MERLSENQTPVFDAYRKVISRAGEVPSTEAFLQVVEPLEQAAAAEVQAFMPMSQEDAEIFVAQRLFASFQAEVAVR